MFLVVIRFKMSQSCALSSSDISLANWLKTHGLVAKKLTIMDALSVTAIPHSPTYVPVLDKLVSSKVFDEVKVIFFTFLHGTVSTFCLNENNLLYYLIQL